MTGMLAQLSRPLWEPQWVADNLDGIGVALLEHVRLTAVSVGIGLVLSLVLAVIGMRNRRLLGPIYAFGGLLYTIPALALFAFLRPVVGIGDAMAIAALTSYTILILVRNIVSALDGVPAEVVEAADGMGYRRVRRFVEIELPLALPVIIAGIRIATVTVIGLVTVTALIGRGGLGAYILTGIRLTTLHPTMILVGTFLSVVLALVVDLSLLALERALTPWSRRKATV
ncbi:MAG: ABC transporter permease [Nitriliruptoraceae bacterium]